MKHPKRICKRCKKPISKSHRWHFVHRKFLWWTLTRTEHRDCLHPEHGPSTHRLKGERELPFPEGVDMIVTEGKYVWKD